MSASVTDSAVAATGTSRSRGAHPSRHHADELGLAFHLDVRRRHRHGTDPAVVPLAVGVEAGDLHLALVDRPAAEDHHVARRDRGSSSRLVGIGDEPEHGRPVTVADQHRAPVGKGVLVEQAVGPGAGHPELEVGRLAGRSALDDPADRRDGRVRDLAIDDLGRTGQQRRPRRTTITPSPAGSCAW